MFPVVKMLTWWVIAILLIPYVHLDEVNLLFALFSSSFLFALLYFNRKISFKYLESSLLLLMIVFVVSLLDRGQKSQVDFNLYRNKENKALLRIKERYKETNYYYKYIVDVRAVYKDSVEFIDTPCLLLQKKDSLNTHFYPGDQLYAEVYWKEIPTAKHEVLFDPSSFWQHKGISEQLWLKNEGIEVLARSNDWFLGLRKLQAIWIELIHKQALSDVSKQIISALVLGDKKGIDKETVDQFTNLGLVHTLALSGLHVSLIYGICAYLLNVLFKYRPKLQSIILVLLIVFYALLTGLSPSVMRASLMFLLYAFSLLINRRTHSFNIVCLSAFILLVYDINLLYNVGFQLSYLAVLGILYFYKHLKWLLENKPIWAQFFIGLAIVSISAQASTGLLSMYYFQKFPTSFLWANLMVLPLITLLLYLSALYLFLLLVGINFSVMHVLLDKSINLLMQFLTFIESYSLAPLVVYVSQKRLIYFYGLLLLICWLLLERRFKGLRFLYLYIVVGVLLFRFSNQSLKKEVFVNASKQGLLVSVIANGEQIVLCDNAPSTSYLLGRYSHTNAIACVDTISIGGLFMNEFCSIDKSFVQVFDEKLLILTDEKVNADVTMKIELLLMRNFRKDIVEIQRIFSPSVVLLDAKLSNKDKKKLIHQWKMFKVEAIDLSKQVYVKVYR